MGISQIDCACCLTLEFVSALVGIKFCDPSLLKFGMAVNDNDKKWSLCFNIYGPT